MSKEARTEPAESLKNSRSGQTFVADRGSGSEDGELGEAGGVVAFVGMWHPI
jgi:hypothetical protein